MSLSKAAGAEPQHRIDFTNRAPTSPIKLQARIKNYSRFFLDTSFVDAVPDEHGERRFFIIKCCEDKIGDHKYFEALRDAIADDAVIRALFDFLCARKIKKMYLGKDIPVGEYQKALKDSRRTPVEHFLECLVEDQPLDDPPPGGASTREDERK